MPLKLFLDDLRPPPDSSWTVARTLEQAQAIMLANDVDDASFDHDLGDPPCDVCEGKCVKPCRHPCHTRPHNGTHLINWMIQNNIWPKHRPTVHSSNPPRREWMEKMIEQHGPYDDTGNRQ